MVIWEALLPTSWYSRLPYVLLLVLLPCYLVVVTMPGGGTFHDDALYMVLAKALAEGEGYRTISLPSELPHTKYPWLYPLVLAPLWRLFPDVPGNFVIFKVLGVVFLVGWCLALRRLLALYGAGSGVIGWVILFTIASPMTFFLAGSVHPDILFACVSILALYQLEVCTHGDGERGYGRVAAAAAFAAAAFLLRSIGLAMIVAGATAFLLRREVRRAVVFVVVCLLLVSPWLAFQALNTVEADFLEGHYTKNSYEGSHALAGHGWDELFHIAIRNAVYQAITFRGLLGTTVDKWTLAIVIGLWGLFLFGFLHGLRRPRVTHLWVFFYTGILMCWLWPPLRYQAPLFPFYVYFALVGFEKLRDRRWLPKKILAAATLTLAVAYAGVGIYGAVRQSLRHDVISISAWIDLDWGHVTSTASWLREHTRLEAILAANHDLLLYLLTDRKGIRPYRNDEYKLFYSLAKETRPVGTLEDLRKRLLRHRIDYVVLTPQAGFLDDMYYIRLQLRLLNAAPEAFQLVHTEPDARYCVYAVDRDRLAQIKPVADLPVR